MYLQQKFHENLYATNLTLVIMNKLLIFLLIVAALSCKKEYTDTQPNIDVNKSIEPPSIDNSGATVLGRQLKNPYSVENMRKALSNIPPSTRAGITEKDIKATHYYVRFSPKSFEELDILQQDSTVYWYDIPLDYEIIEYGNYYHDPSIPDNLPTFQYASIEVSKWPEISQLGIKYDILSELFIPDEEYDDVNNTLTKTDYDNVFVESIVNESLRLTYNLDESSDTPETKGSSKWRPAGRISYYDEVKNKEMGIEGVEVRAHRWFTTHTGITDENGYYICDGRFRRPARYSFNFTRYQFVVHGTFPRLYHSSKIKGDWDYFFSRSDSEYELCAATVFRAAYHYYYKDIGDLRRPPMNGFWRTKMKLKVINETNENENGDFSSSRRFLGLGSAIKIYNPEHSTDRIYATTIHELAHAAHWRMIVEEPGTNRYRDYHNAEDKMVQSWATGVQWYLTKMVYPSYRGRQNDNPDCTNVVIDLVDSRADDGTNNGKTYYEGDKVEGYTMGQIETALQGCNTWEKWRDNIINSYENETKQYVEQLFALW